VIYFTSDGHDQNNSNLKHQDHQVARTPFEINLIQLIEVFRWRSHPLNQSDGFSIALPDATA